MKKENALSMGGTTLLILGLLSDGAMYGYQMIEALKARSNDVFALKAGTLYPLLHALEQEGLVVSYEVQQEAARPRKYYQLTDDGNRALEEKRKKWKRYAQAVNTVLGGVEYAAK